MVLAANRWHVFAPAAGENGVWWAGYEHGWEMQQAVA